MGVALPPDVTSYVDRSFAAHERGEALALLEGAALHDGTAPGPRLVRCAAVASGGSLERLRMEIETLKHDYRDVIVEGEYEPKDGKLVRLRDLNDPIEAE